MTTTTKARTLKDELDLANPNTLADALRQVAVGSLLTPVGGAEVTLGALASTVTLDPPALAILSLEVTDVTAGSGAVGARIISSLPAVAPHAAGVPGVANLSADGATLTFEGTILKYKCTYLPKPATDLDDNFVSSAP